MTDVRDRIIDFRRVRASELVHNPKNYRTHNDAQRDMLRDLMSTIGFAGAELVRVLPDGRLMLIDGHLRAEELGDTLLPTLVTDLDEHEADVLLATYDPISRLAGTDHDLAEQLIASLSAHGDDSAARLLSTIAQHDNTDTLLKSLAGDSQRSTTPNEPKGGDLEKQLGVFVPCKDEREQQRVYLMLQEMGVQQCKIVTL